jgi:hypothetical protein
MPVSPKLCFNERAARPRHRRCAEGSPTAEIDAFPSTTWEREERGGRNPNIEIRVSAATPRPSRHDGLSIQRGRFCENQFSAKFTL